MITIAIDAVSKSFSRGSEKISILQNLNLVAKKGEKVAVLGPSGSGKSTLLSIMAGLDQPDDGKVSILDQDLSSLNESKLTSFRGRNLGIVFQQFHLVRGLNAKQNVMLPLEINRVPNADKRAMEMLDRVGLANRASHQPSQLSGGECQRVALARAIAGKPPVIFADEPSGNLDEQTGIKVMDYLFNLVSEEQSTLILVTHNKKHSVDCDRTLLLREGQLHAV
ncbi:ABC transporter ATP-binding protein [Oligoflexaceae bacterium]|nr:ABC transporter ATP-binding protein [Oligoflexaceae bacterium]